MADETMTDRPTHPILIVDDDAALLEALARTLQRAGHGVRTAQTAELALEEIEREAPGLLLTDLMLPGVDGIELLKRVKAISSHTEVLLITAHASVERAVEAMRYGAYDFVEKPVERERLLRIVTKALEKQRLAEENTRLKERLAEHESADRFVGVSPPVLEIKKLVAQIAPTDVPVLITGDSGTGKELVADLVHQRSRRHAGPLVKVSCAAIPENLLESELFGYERGAFTGAAHAKPGRFETADGGTLFLDEIGDMSAPMQAKLLRVLQDGRVQRLGGTRDIQVDVRIVAATNVNIDQAIVEKRFREDLYHRLNVIEITLPALRERSEDVPLLVAHFLKVYRKIRQTPLEGIDADALEALSRHPWPGNVRELENVVQRALATAPGPTLTAADLKFAAARGRPASTIAGADGVLVPAGTRLADAEELLIQDALKRSHGDKEMAARILGISARTLYRHAQKGTLPAHAGELSGE